MCGKIMGRNLEGKLETHFNVSGWMADMMEWPDHPHKIPTKHTRPCNTATCTPHTIHPCAHVQMCMQSCMHACTCTHVQYTCTLHTPAVHAHSHATRTCMCKCATRMVHARNCQCMHSTHQPVGTQIDRYRYTYT